MSAPTLPLIIAEGLDIGIYDSLEAARLALEGEDVAAGIYTCFDAEGRRFDIGWGAVGAVIHDYLGSQPGPAALEELLKAFLRHFNDAAARETGASLGSLTAAARRYARRGSA